MCLFSRWKLEGAIMIATARFVGTRDAATASKSVIRLVFPDVRTTLAWRTSVIVYIGTGMLADFVFWMICLMGKEVS